MAKATLTKLKVNETGKASQTLILFSCQIFKFNGKVVRCKFHDATRHQNTLKHELRRGNDATSDGHQCTFFNVALRSIIQPFKRRSKEV